MELAEKTSYKRGATDFSSQVARMKAANCDLVVLGTIIRETIGTDRRIAQDRLQPDLPRLQRGLHRPDPQARRAGDERPVRQSMGAQHPYLDEASQPIRFWANKYKTKFNEDPTVFSVYGYIHRRCLRAGSRTRRAANLTTDSFIKAMDTMVIPHGHVRQRRSQLQRRRSAWAATPRACRRSSRWQVEGDLGLRHSLMRERARSGAAIVAARSFSEALHAADNSPMPDDAASGCRWNRSISKGRASRTAPDGKVVFIEGRCRASSVAGVGVTRARTNGSRARCRRCNARVRSA